MQRCSDRVCGVHLAAPGSAAVWVGVVDAVAAA
jgi:hypothetical protein